MVGMNHFTLGSMDARHGSQHRSFRSLWIRVLAIAGLSLAIHVAAAAEQMPRIPAYQGASAQAPATRSQTAVLAGGCFWGVQAVFQHVKGVTRAESGYAGGEPEHASYDLVSTGQTGHAEAVRVTFDPAVVSYARLLQIFFSVVHDPTQLDRQGPDVGPQYRSAIFAQDAAQARIAREYIAQLDRERVFGHRIVTKVEGRTSFHPAEAYHQDFLVRNPANPYIVAHDLPKLEGLRSLFAGDYRPQPVLIRR